MPAAWPSCALTIHKLGLFVPSTSVGPVGQLQEENYTCVGIAMSRNHINGSYLFGCTCMTQAKEEALNVAPVVSHLSGLQLIERAAVFLAWRVPAGK